MMKYFFASLFLVGNLLACSGDCLSCHPKLEATILSDKRHSPMLTCVQCHKNESAGMSACGKDCFSCHPIEKIAPDVPEHDVIQQCANCHKKIPVIQEVVPSDGSQTMMKSLLFN